MIGGGLINQKLKLWIDLDAESAPQVNLTCLPHTLVGLRMLLINAPGRAQGVSFDQKNRKEKLLPVQ